MRGRVRLHAVKMRASGGVEADDERRKSLAENSEQAAGAARAQARAAPILCE